jgi:hypothetical protein
MNMCAVVLGGMEDIDGQEIETKESSIFMASPYVTSGTI